MKNKKELTGKFEAAIKRYNLAKEKSRSKDLKRNRNQDFNHELETVFWILVEGGGNLGKDVWEFEKYVIDCFRKDISVHDALKNSGACFGAEDVFEIEHWLELNFG